MLLAKVEEYRLNKKVGEKKDPEKEEKGTKFVDVDYIVVPNSVKNGINHEEEEEEEEEFLMPENLDELDIDTVLQLPEREQKAIIKR